MSAAIGAPGESDSRHRQRAVTLALALVACSTSSTSGSGSLPTDPDQPLPGAQAAAAGYPSPDAVSTAVATEDESELGARLVEQFGCTSCHEIIDRHGNELPHPVGGRDCQGCHRRIISGDFPAEPDKLARWQKELPRQFDVPTLRGAGRFARTWLISYLLQPHDIRPSLDSQMPRIPMTRAQAEAIADFLGARPRAVEGELSGDAARGARLVAQSACATCHAPEANLVRAAILAPDLAYATRRYASETLIQWLIDPLAMKSDALMPGHAFTRADAADIVAHLATLSPPTPPPFAPPASLLLEREVRFPEVHAILRARCLHCHNRPKRTGPGGPGYTGGWGYEGKRLGLLTYGDVIRGGETAAGERHRLSDRMPDGYSRLVSHLIARHLEYSGTHGDTVGMPLGQPPLTWPEIQVMHTWMERGQRR